MIKYDIGLGETCITVGLAKIEQGTAPDGRIKYDYMPVITFERLLKPQEIGSPVTEDTMKLDGAALFIHNRAGLKQMEKMVSLLKEILDKKEAEEKRLMISSLATIRGSERNNKADVLIPIIIVSIGNVRIASRKHKKGNGWRKTHEVHL